MRTRIGMQTDTMTTDSDNDDYKCPDPIRSYKIKVKVINGERQRTGIAEHTEAAAGPDRLREADIPSVTGSVGEGAIERSPYITSDKWVTKLYYRPPNRDTESASSGEGAARVLGRVAGREAREASLRRPESVPEHVAPSGKVRNRRKRRLMDRDEGLTRLSIVSALRDLQEMVIKSSPQELNKFLTDGEFGCNRLLDCWERQEDKGRDYSILSLKLNISVRAIQ